jgi:hypothetical protein
MTESLGEGDFTEQQILEALFDARREEALWAAPSAEQRERAASFVGDPIVRALGRLPRENTDAVIERIVMEPGQTGRDFRLLTGLDRHEWHTLMQACDSDRPLLIDLAQRMIARKLAIQELGDQKYR